MRAAVDTPSPTPKLTLAPAAAPVGRREQTKAANRAAILAAAREVFSELGYGAASVRDIIRRTDLAAGTFYNYFPDKESIFRELLDVSGSAARPRVQAARAAATNLEEFVRGGYGAYFAFMAEDRVILDLLRRNAGTIQTLADVPSFGAGVADLEHDIGAAVAAGTMPPVDAAYMAAAMAGVAFEVAGRMIERDPVDVEGATEFATALFLGGIAGLAEPA